MGASNTYSSWKFDDDVDNIQIQLKREYFQYFDFMDSIRHATVTILVLLLYAKCTRICLIDVIELFSPECHLIFKFFV